MTLTGGAMGDFNVVSLNSDGTIRGIVNKRLTKESCEKLAQRWYSCYACDLVFAVRHDDQLKQQNRKHKLVGYLLEDRVSWE